MDWGIPLKNLLLYILVAAALVVGYLVLTGRLFKEDSRRPEGRDTVRELVDSGRNLGDKGGKAFKSVEFGGKK